MRFVDVKGQFEIKELLIKIVDEKRVSHAMLFSEEPGYGGLALALATVQYMACKNKSKGDSCGVCPTCNKIQKLIHPDLHFAVPVNTTKKISSDKKPITDYFLEIWRANTISNPYFSEEEWYESIGMEEKRGLISVNESYEIIRKLSLVSYEGGDKYMLIWLPERMNREAANKLLKILEEPAPGTYFILVTQSAGELLSTIISRCQIINIKPESTSMLASAIIEEFHLTEQDANLRAKEAAGSYGKAVKLIKGSETENQFFLLFGDLLNYCIKKDLTSVISLWEEIAVMGREKQKQFCEFSLDFLRKSYMISLNNEGVANIPQAELMRINQWANNINPSFYTKAYSALNKAIQDLDRNVNSKFVFADLSNRFFISL